jgi:hypothetical protein
MEDLDLQAPLAEGLAGDAEFVRPFGHGGIILQVGGGSNAKFSDVRYTSAIE